MPSSSSVRIAKDRLVFLYVHSGLCIFNYFTLTLIVRKCHVLYSTHRYTKIAASSETYQLQVQPGPVFLGINTKSIFSESFSYNLGSSKSTSKFQHFLMFSCLFNMSHFACTIKKEKNFRVARLMGTIDKKVLSIGENPMGTNKHSYRARTHCSSQAGVVLLIR